ncbi:hypothetical protein [Vibrio splendidus]|uniref:hypothetical protein n=1 Tax=Vibrio splendidus TaxID=29497 RepID=UPI003D0AF1B6
MANYEIDIEKVLNMIELHRQIKNKQYNEVENELFDNPEDAELLHIKKICLKAELKALGEELLKITEL